MTIHTADDYAAANATVRQAGVVPLADLERACAVLATSPMPDDRMIAERIAGKAMAEDFDQLFAHMQTCQRKQRRLIIGIAAFCAAVWAGLIAVLA